MYEEGLRIYNVFVIDNYEDLPFSKNMGCCEPRMCNNRQTSKKRFHEGAFATVHFDTGVGSTEVVAREH